MCFVWIWEQTAIIFLYGINWLVFITEMECVYCAVRTEFFNYVTLILRFKGLKDFLGALWKLYNTSYRMLQDTVMFVTVIILKLHS
jgi:hypothetical protein